MAIDSASTLARNAFLNLFTQIAISILAFLSIPWIVHSMGEEEFGALSFIWLVIGYFSILDLGLGQASVKFLAEQLAHGNTERVNETISTSVILASGVGCLVSVSLWLVAPAVISSMLSSGSGVRTEVETSFMLAVMAIPFVMLQGVLRSVPTAMQRFDLVNAVAGMSGLVQWGGALVLVTVGYGLYQVTVLTVAIRVAGAIASLVIARRLVPRLSLGRTHRFISHAKEIMRFGGWLTVSSLASPIVRYLDRVFVATYYSMRTFTFYVVPYEAMLRLQVIPLSLSSTLFPSMAARSTLDRDSLRALYARALHWMAVAMVPIGIVLVVFSDRLLDIWLGPIFRSESNIVFKLLAIAMVLVGICYVPITLLQAIGRPDVVSKLYLAEIPAYVGLCFLLIPDYGINGAAVVWLIRMVGSTAVLLWTSRRVLQGGLMPHLGRRLTRLTVVNLMFLGALLSVSTIGGNTLSILVAAVITLGYSFAAWRFCLDETDRGTLRHVVRYGFVKKQEVSGDG